jgi:DNA-binding CsgD family transcriptional regulator
LVRKYVAPLLRHRYSIAVLGSFTFDHLIIRHMVGVDYPQAYLRRIPTHTWLGDRPVIGKWLSKREPLVIDPIRDRALLSVFEVQEVDEFGLGRMGVHGLIDESKNMSYFSFAGMSEMVSDERATFILQSIVPHLHSALRSIPTMSMADPQVPLLTAQEGELIGWIAAGRSNAEIAELRGRSASTVVKQLRALFRKLQVKTRADVVAIATRQRRV